MTEYLVRFDDGQSTTVRADKVNLGQRKLWFYDGQDHLIAVFLWEQLVGFEVVGSAAEQLFVEHLPHERRINLTTELQQKAAEERGKITVLIEHFVDTLKGTTDELRHQWVSIDDENKKKTEVQLIVQRHGGTIQQLQAAMIDANQRLQRTLELMQTEFRDMGLPTLPGLEARPTGLDLPIRSTTEEAGEKKKRWFT